MKNEYRALHFFEQCEKKYQEAPLSESERRMADIQTHAKSATLDI